MHLMMLSSKLALKVLKGSDWSKLSAASCAGALVASGIVTYNCREIGENDKDETNNGRLLSRGAGGLFDKLILPLFVPNTTSCFFWRPRGISIKESATKATLQSRYDVRFERPIGEGGFGAVFFGTDKLTKEPVAIKQINKSFTDNDSFNREMSAFLHIRDKGGHPNICGLREHFEEGDFFYLVLDLVSGGELFDHLINNGAYSEADAARLLREVGSALAFLHGIGLVHGDLKPENLMLSSKNPMDAVLEVVDFGCAQVVDSTSPYYHISSGIAATTPGYSSPEMIDKSRKLTCLEPSMDMFAVGVILYVMLCGFHPYDLDGTATNEDLNHRVLSRKPPPLRYSRLTAHLSSSAIDLIESLMDPNPKKRLSAQQLLNHPWVRGETALTRKIRGSDERLSTYRKYRSRLEAKVFQNMVQLSGESSSDVTKRASLIEQSFRKLDPDNKGYISTRQLKRLDSAMPKSDATDDEEQLHLAGFSDLLSDHMKSKYFPTSHVIYREGERGENMYFINSGRVEVSTKDGFRTIVEQGDFFGEGALLSVDSKRTATVKTVTPVHVIEIHKEYFEKYLADGYDTHLSLRERDRTRKRLRAKTILASTKNMEERLYSKGARLYEQGKPGNDVFILESGEANVTINGRVVFTVKPGELCGEYAAIFGKPRNTSATCISRQCIAHILKAEDFKKIVEDSPTLKESLKDIAHTREFQKALVFKTKKAFPTNESELRAAFEEADYRGVGKIDLSDITVMLKQIDPSWSSSEIEEIFVSLDLDGSGYINWEEFQRLFAIQKK